MPWPQYPPPATALGYTYRQRHTARTLDLGVVNGRGRGAITIVTGEDRSLSTAQRGTVGYGSYYYSVDFPVRGTGTMKLLTGDLLGGGVGFDPPRFFLNNVRGVTSIDEKLGIPLRTSI